MFPMLLASILFASMLALNEMQKSLCRCLILNGAWRADPPRERDKGAMIMERKVS